MKVFISYNFDYINNEMTRTLRQLHCPHFDDHSHCRKKTCFQIKKDIFTLVLLSSPYSVCLCITAILKLYLCPSGEWKQSSDVYAVGSGKFQVCTQLC